MVFALVRLCSVKEVYGVKRIICSALFVLVMSALLALAVDASKPVKVEIGPGQLEYGGGLTKNGQWQTAVFLITGDGALFAARFEENPMLEETSVELKYRLNNGAWQTMTGYNHCIFTLSDVKAGDVIKCKFRVLGVKETGFYWQARIPLVIY